MSLDEGHFDPAHFLLFSFFFLSVSIHARPIHPSHQLFTQSSVLSLITRPLSFPRLSLSDHLGMPFTNRPCASTIK